MKINIFLSIRLKFNMNSNPLVTVYIPTCNRVNLLSRAVESVLDQGYKNLEVIVVDDCSSDATVKFLETQAGKDSRLHYFVNPENKGACFSRNRAILAAKGEFITGLDDDDYFFSERLENFIRRWNHLSARHKSLIFLFSNGIVQKNNEKQRVKYKRPRKIKKSDLIISNFVGNQVFVKTKDLQDVLFDANLPVWQDLDCWYRLISNGVAVNTNCYDYVTDVSHPHERISKKKISKIDDVIDNLSIKYNLSKGEREVLECQLYSYSLSKLTFRVFLKKMLSMKSFKSGYYLSRKLAKSIFC